MTHSHAPAMRDLRHTNSLGARQRRALWATLGLNAGYLVVEVVAGLLIGSLALLADAAHMSSDVLALGVALFAQSLAERPATARHTFGLRRAEVLGALANALLLLGATAWILIEATRRLSDPQVFSGPGLLVVAAAGLAVNLVSVYLLARSRGRNLNLRAAHLHMVSDAAGSVAVVIAAVAVIGWDAYWVDPLASFVIGGLVIAATWGLLRDTIHVLMEGAPRGLVADEVEGSISEYEGVGSVHHLHLWNLSPEMPALSAHVVLEGEVSLHEAQVRGDALKEMLADRFGIGHVTLELECHDCEASSSTTGDVRGRRSR